MRLFVALEIPAAVRDNLSALGKELQPLAKELRWVAPGNFHVTLKFLGETPSKRLASIREALGAVRSKEAAALRFQGLGFFPNERRPSVLWAGIEYTAALQAVAAQIDKCLKRLGFLCEKREFKPHLTLARFKEARMPEEFHSTVLANANREFGSLQASAFQLMQSRLKTSGAEYSQVESFRFSEAQE